MKKLFLFGAAALLAMGAMTSCQQKTSSDSDDAEDKPSVDNPAVADGADTGVEADIDAGYNPDRELPVVEDAMQDTDEAAGVATMDDRAAVVQLADDSAYRPGKKVSRLTILDFNAVWCGPCKQFAPVFDDAAKEFGQKVDFVSVDIDNNPQTANAFGIQAVPTIVFMYPNGTSKAYEGLGDLMPANKFIGLVVNAIK